MEEQPPRTSDRSNKGVPPKRFDPPGGGQSPAAPIVQASNSAGQTPSNIVPPPPQGGNKAAQTSAIQPDLYRILADMQKEMMKQINSVNNNLNSLITTQNMQTNASIASLQQEIQAV